MRHEMALKHMKEQREKFAEIVKEKSSSECSSLSTVRKKMIAEGYLDKIEPEYKRQNV